MVLIGSGLAIIVSLALFTSLVIRPTASLNWLNGYTLALTTLAGTLGVISSKKVWLQAIAIALLILGAYPTVVSATVYFYVVPLFLMLSGMFLQLLQTKFRHEVDPLI